MKTILKILGLDEEKLRKSSKVSGWAFLIASVVLLVAGSYVYVYSRNVYAEMAARSERAIEAVNNDPTIPQQNAHIREMAKMLSVNIDSQQEDVIFGLVIVTTLLFAWHGVVRLQIYRILNKVQPVTGASCLEDKAKSLR
ncbi:MAG: hypothetical protein NTY53_14485 [Kiritimatiellaeota bacterium]|nr:hypothetical protein [Kiritimatiellota bacterium]